MVLTIPAAGSEVSPGMVITNEEGWYKRASVSELIFPKFAVLNPEFTFSLSAKQTITGVSDILAHIFERYFTQEKNAELTDRLAEATIKTVINNLRLFSIMAYYIGFVLRRQRFDSAKRLLIRD